MSFIDITFNGEPIPAVRVTGKSLWTPRAKRYAAYKKALAEYIQAQSRERMSGKLALVATYYRSTKRRCDIDNLLKSTMDALTLAGVIGDDSQIEAVFAVKELDKDSPRVVFRLAVVEGVEKFQVRMRGRG